MLALATPASLADCMATLAPDGRCHRFVWTVARHQVAMGPSYAARDEDGRALALVGFWPEPEYREVWVVLAPAAAPRMREVLGLARLTLREQEHSDGRPMVAVARTRAGRRIAALLGFEQRREGIFVRERTTRG